MGDFLESMRNSRETYPVEFLQFTRVYQKHRNKIFCFHEGKMDDKYYSLRIQPYLEGKEIYYNCCNGKDNVVKINELLHKNMDYINVEAIYFVDSDFDESLQNSEIYETPCYSIENFYSNEYLLKQILLRIFYLIEDDYNYFTVITKFKELQKMFHKVILPLNAWIYFQRQQERIRGEKRKLKLDKLKFDELYSITLDKITMKYDREYLRAKFPEAYVCTDEEWDQIQNEFYQQEEKHVIKFRGKYEFHFICSFLELIIVEYNKCKKSKKDNLFKASNDMKKITLNVSSKSEELLAILSIYAYTPPCIKEYIESMNEKFKEVS